MEEKQSLLVILRRVYLQITDNHCAAKLIEYFKHWRKWKLKNHRTDWVYMPLKRIYEDLMREHSVGIIRGAIALLIDLRILEQRHNPSNGQDRTWQYRLNLEVLQSKLAKLNNEVPTFRSEQCINTQDPTQISKPQQAVVVVEKEDEEVENAEREISRLSPDLKVTQPIKAAIKQHWHNFPAALERLKKAVRENWRCNWMGVFINALKQGVPLEEAPPQALEYPHPTLEQLNSIGQLGELVYTRLNEPGYPEVLAVNMGSELVVWWKAIAP